MAFREVIIEDMAPGTKYDIYRDWIDKDGRVHIAIQYTPARDKKPNVQKATPICGKCHNCGESLMKQIKLGKSQKAVFDWLKEHPRSKAKDIGEALYDKTSSCANWQTDWPKVLVRREWASKLLSVLIKKGCVEQVERGVYSVVPSMCINEAE